MWSIGKIKQQLFDNAAPRTYPAAMLHNQCVAQENNSPFSGGDQSSEADAVTLSPWSLYVIVAHLFSVVLQAGDVQLFRTLKSINRDFYVASRHRLSKHRRCRCDCERMKEWRIRDGVRRWWCAECNLSLAWGATWQMSDFYSRKIHLTICRRCFQHHWLNTAYRPLYLCLRDKEERNLLDSSDE